MTQDIIKKHYRLLNITLIYFSLSNIGCEIYQYFYPPLHKTKEGLGLITIISFLPIIFIFLRSNIVSLKEAKVRINRDLRINLPKGVIFSLLISGAFLLFAYALRKFNVVDMFQKENYISGYALVYLVLTVMQELLFRILFWEMGYSHIMRLQDRSILYRCLVSSILFSVPHEAWGIKVILVSFVGNMIFHWFYIRHRNMVGVIILHFVLGWAFFDFAVK